LTDCIWLQARQQKKILTPLDTPADDGEERNDERQADHGLFQLKVAAGENGLEREVKGGYCGDLLSDVMANAPAVASG